MSQQIINVGSAPNDGTGDLLRNSQIKANANFTELYNIKIESVVAGTNVTIDDTDPLNPIVNATGGGGGGVESVTGDSVDNADPLNPIIKAIPLSGTTGGNPVTGDIELNNLSGAKRIKGNAYNSYIEFVDDGLVNINNDIASSNVVIQGVSFVGVSDVGSGISGSFDYTPNITDLDYVQKIYVDEKLVTNPTVTGSYAIDWSNDVWDLTLTGNTTLTESNLPASGKTKTITLNISGNHTLTYPAGWTSKITGAYSGTATLNTITIQYYGVGKYKVLIVQPS